MAEGVSLDELFGSLKGTSPPRISQDREQFGRQMPEEKPSQHKDEEESSVLPAAFSAPSMPETVIEERVASAPIPRASVGGGRDLETVMAMVNLQFASLQEKLSAQFATINAKLDDLDVRLSRMQDGRTPPPPSYSHVAHEYPAPPPSFYRPPQQYTEQPMLPPPPASYFAPAPSQRSSYPPLPPTSVAPIGGSRVPTAANTAVCNRCFLYFRPVDLRSHTPSCWVGRGPQQQQNQLQHHHQQQQQQELPAASAPPPPSTVSAAMMQQQQREGRVVIHKGQYYWIPGDAASSSSSSSSSSRPSNN